MICRACRVAGDISSGDAGQPIQAEGLDEARQMVIRLHFECRGGTWCECQHRTDAGKLEVNIGADGRPLPGWALVGPAEVRRVGVA